VDNGLERSKWIVHPDQLSNEIKIHEEQNNAKVDERERGRDEEDSSHLEQKDQSRNKTCLDFTANTSDATHNSNMNDNHKWVAVSMSRAWQLSANSSVDCPDRNGFCQNIGKEMKKNV